jgi:hypothetical protein
VSPACSVFLAAFKMLSWNLGFNQMEKNNSQGTTG